jgi:hypothetical protein
LNPVLELLSGTENVFGGLPKPKPTGLPILPLPLGGLAVPKPVNDFPAKAPKVPGGVVGLSPEDDDEERPKPRKGLELSGLPKRLVVVEKSFGFGVKLLPNKLVVAGLLFPNSGCEELPNGVDFADSVANEPKVNVDLVSGCESNVDPAAEVPKANVGAGGPVGKELVDSPDGNEKVKPELDALEASGIDVNPAFGDSVTWDADVEVDCLNEPPKLDGGVGIATGGDKDFVIA